MVEHRCAQDAHLGTGSHWSGCRARFESIWTEELGEAEVPIRVEAEFANRALGAVPIDPNVRVGEPVEPAGASAGCEPSATRGGVASTTWHNGSYETSSRNTTDAEQC